ncbi:MAG: methyltransferase, partial [Clostridia bacterium]|nr:methyltransferase [Clostridia bacterium]
MTDKSLEKRIEINERLSLRIRESGLSFGTDAYLLSAFLRDGKGGSGADLGCGTGVLSLFAAARRHFTEIVAYEIQEEYA